MRYYCNALGCDGQVLHLSPAEVVFCHTVTPIKTRYVQCRIQVWARLKHRRRGPGDQLASHLESFPLPYVQVLTGRGQRAKGEYLCSSSLCHWVGYCFHGIYLDGVGTHICHGVVPEARAIGPRGARPRLRLDSAVSVRRRECG